LYEAYWVLKKQENHLLNLRFAEEFEHCQVLRDKSENCLKLKSKPYVFLEDIWLYDVMLIRTYTDILCKSEVMLLVTLTENQSPKEKFSVNPVSAAVVWKFGISTILTGVPFFNKSTEIPVAAVGT
jgi:hypothetical protein